MTVAFIDHAGLGNQVMLAPFVQKLQRLGYEVAVPDGAFYRCQELMAEMDIRPPLLYPPLWRRFYGTDRPNIRETFSTWQVNIVINLRTVPKMADRDYDAFKTAYPARYLELYDLPDENRVAPVSQRVHSLLDLGGLGLVETDPAPLVSLRREMVSPRVGLVVGASTLNKQVSADLWTRLIREYDVEVPRWRIFFGDRAEREVAERIRDSAARANVELIATSSIAELAHELANTRCILTNDTGPAHLSAACGTPTLGIHLTSSAKVWGVQGPDASTIDVGGYRNCPMNDPVAGSCSSFYAGCRRACRTVRDPEDFLDSCISFIRANL